MFLGMVLNILTQYPSHVLPASDSYLDFSRAPCVLYGVKYIDPVSPARVAGVWEYSPDGMPTSHLNVVSHFSKKACKKNLVLRCVLVPWVRRPKYVSDPE